MDGRRVLAPPRPSGRFSRMLRLADHLGVGPAAEAPRMV